MQVRVNEAFQSVIQLVPGGFPDRWEGEGKLCYD